jgi:hypothetical protein
MPGDALNFSLDTREGCGGLLVSDTELSLLNFYRASELHGGLILGQMARRARDSDLMAKLTRHSAEGMMHALWWTETITRLGGLASPIARTYQNRSADKAGTPISFLEVMAMSSAFEHRIYRYFTLHLRQASVHPVVAGTLRRMLVDERWHLTWIREWLRDDALTDARKVSAAISRYSAADQLICEELSVAYGFRKAA